ncbi:hypothetical protein D3C75_847160 [compost metagenome]
MPADSIQFMKLEGCLTCLIHIHNITAFRSGLFDTAPLNVPRVYNRRLLMQNTAFMYMSQRPIVVTAADQIFAAAG